MNRYLLILMLAAIFTDANAQFNLKKLGQQAKEIVTGTEDGKLSDEDIIAGLKEALTIGSKNAGDIVSKVDGYYKNPEVFIPMPASCRYSSSSLGSKQTQTVLASCGLFVAVAGSACGGPSAIEARICKSGISPAIPA